ncbi:hypothetical protein C1H46_039349 [Malus baccata]|uniref:Uncharacterized protein n=1 Tax=Malus baccata TaxID=106549 RepID=A0A540KLN2_MALBA|nr:hypothetical protein C1H46_039349 [Malus baccata]
MCNIAKYLYFCFLSPQIKGFQRFVDNAIESILLSHYNPCQHRAARGSSGELQELQELHLVSKEVREVEFIRSLFFIELDSMLSELALCYCWLFFQCLLEFVYVALEEEIEKIKRCPEQDSCDC